MIRKEEIEEFLMNTDFSKHSIAQTAWIDFYKKTGNAPDHMVLSVRDYYSTMDGILSGKGEDFFALVCFPFLKSSNIKDGKPFCFNYEVVSNQL